MVSIAPFLLVLGLLVYLVPAPEEPYDWNFAVQAWEKVTDAVRWVGRWFGSDEDYDAVIGFSDSGSFYGNLADSDEIVMRLSGNQNQGSVVYLRGKVMDSFDGRSWTDTYSDENRDDMLDVLETLCAVHRFDPEYLGNYLRKTELKLKYEDFNTRYLFAPLKALPRWNHIDQKTYTERGGNLIAGEQLGYGTEYAVSYYRMNRDHAEFERLLETAKRPDEALWNDIRAKYESRDTGGVRTEERDNGISGISYPAYLSYRDRIRAYYLPETKLSEGVAAYVTGITEGAETDYEKLKRIEQALGGFRYSVNPGVLAEEVVSPETFLDDFILKKQEGYCSYFATAFVLLARSQGIPARYVQGFRVPTKGKNSVEVRSGMSHAWPEAYLDGVGWIAFEPTPGKKSPVSWSVLKKQERVTDAGEGIEEHEELTRPEQTVPDPDSATGGEDSPFSIRLILIPVGLIAAFLLVFLLAGRLAAVARYRRLDEKGRFRVICNRNFRILDYLGYSIRQGETLEELYERANENMKSDALAFLKECELVAYAGKPVDRESLSGAEKSRNALLEHLKEKKGKWFFLYRFRLSRES